jgi:hypothetical protein
MESFLSDCWEAFVISLGYGMGDPLAPAPKERDPLAPAPKERGEQGGGRHHPSVTP